MREGGWRGVFTGLKKIRVKVHRAYLIGEERDSFRRRNIGDVLGLGVVESSSGCAMP